MSEEKKEIYKGEGTFKSIDIDDFYINQNNNTESFGKCPDCENDTLNIETRECECGYNLAHEIKDITDNTENIVDSIIDNEDVNNGPVKKFINKPSDLDYIRQSQQKERDNYRR